LGVPFGGPNRGKDSDGEFFSAKTDLQLDRFSSPLVTYYHGLTPDGRPQGDPEIIGQVKGYEKRADGVWWRVLLDKSSAYAKRVWEAAKRGVARASSGSIAHLVRKAASGEILNWPIVELTLLDADGKRQPANQFAVALPVAQKTYRKAGATLPLLPDAETPEAAGDAAAKSAPANNQLEDFTMDEIKQAVAEALKAEREAREAAEQAEKAEQERINAAVKAARATWEEEAAKSNRLPSDKGAPHVTRYNDSKFDDLTPGEHALMIQIAENAYRSGRTNTPASDLAIKSLALKLESGAEKGDRHNKAAMKTLHAGAGRAVKADELNRSTLASYGDEWIGVQYSSDLWEKIRANTWVLAELESKGGSDNVPDGYESDVVPLESTDPTWYKVAQAADATSGRPDVTVTASKIKTGQKAVSLAKMGCRVMFTGELVEDSLIRWVPNAYRQIQVSGQEQFEHAIIDGDTDLTITTNINDIGGTPAGTEVFALVDGFRKLALVTNTANSRDGGALDVTDFLETLKLMGGAGLHGSDPTKTTFVVDPWTYWKCMELEEVKTRDVFSQPTIENGVLSSIWGYPLKRSYFAQYAGVLLGTVSTATYQYKSNSAGKVDQDTQANNTKGMILAVNWSQWRLKWKRRMTIEVSRWPESDTNQIVAMVRWGLGYRDTEASAITYNLTV
jgi:hypothetical protein